MQVACLSVGKCLSGMERRGDISLLPFLRKVYGKVTQLIGNTRKALEIIAFLFENQEAYNKKWEKLKAGEKVKAYNDSRKERKYFISQ